jgi:hypothetical protein
MSDLKITGNNMKLVKRNGRPIGENTIKANIILEAWLSYCRESRIYRILEYFGLR